MQICITGCHTNVGKTYVSAMLCSILGFEYFKLIQAGEPKDKDLVTHFAPQCKVGEGISLQMSASPHLGKRLENAKYDGLSTPPLPKSQNLIIEIVGGLYSPLDENSCMIDYISKYSLPCIVVGADYLGGINHLLLSIEALKTRECEILGVVISGESRKEIERFVREYSGVGVVNLANYNKENFERIKANFEIELKKLLKI